MSRENSAVNRQYKIEEALGAGGFAQVFRALDQESGRVVALKRLVPPEGMAPEDWEKNLSRFEREAQALLSLSSPNIAKVYNYSLDPKEPFLALEYIPGQSLGALLSEQGPLDFEKALDLSGQVLQGLIHAHELGMIHRDIKPQNIMVEDALWQGQRAVLIDFGIVKTRSTKVDLTTGDHMLGTPRYMSPEQILGGEIDARCDLYSLGLTIYEMVSGEHAIQGSDAIAIVAKHIIGEELITLDHLLLPNDFKQWLLTMTQQLPEDRFASAREALEALQACSLELEVSMSLSQPPLVENTVKLPHLDTQDVPPPARLSSPTLAHWALLGGVIAVIAFLVIWKSLETPEPPAVEPALTTSASVKEAKASELGEPAVVPKAAPPELVEPEEKRPAPVHKNTKKKSKKVRKSRKKTPKRTKRPPSSESDPFKPLELQP